MPQDKHTHKRFDIDLEAIRANILKMGGLVEMQFKQALHALCEADGFLACQVINQDQRVNRLGVEIDGLCYATIARHQPTASDLRSIIIATKVIVHLERIGDEAKKIARVAERFSQPNCLAIPRFSGVHKAAELAQEMLREVLDSFARLDPYPVRNVMDYEDLVDEEFRTIFHRLIGFMTDNTRTISASLEVLFIAKAIERIGDHVKLISELVIDASNRYGEIKSIKSQPVYELGTLSSC